MTLRHLAVGVVVLAAACGVFPERVTASDPRVKSLFAAMAAVDRTALGFTPVPADAELRLEVGPRSGYDVMLHIESRTSRTVSFRKTASGYEWIGEQEIHRGPKKWVGPDGEFAEEVTITVQRVPGTGNTGITYSGEDPRLAFPRKLTLADVEPILAEWDSPK